MTADLLTAALVDEIPMVVLYHTLMMPCCRVARLSPMPANGRP
jgi:hypothetical protein